MEVAMYLHSSLQLDVLSDLPSKKKFDLPLSSVPSSNDRKVEQESIKDKKDLECMRILDFSQHGDNRQEDFSLTLQVLLLLFFLCP